MRKRDLKKQIKNLEEQNYYLISKLAETKKTSHSILVIGLNKISFVVDGVEVFTRENKDIKISDGEYKTLNEIL